MLDRALAAVVTPGNAENAARHVWGYFKTISTDKERDVFSRKLARYRDGKLSLQAVHKALKLLALQYEASYLLQSLYFEDWRGAGA